MKMYASEIISLKERRDGQINKKILLAAFRINGKLTGVN